MNTQEKRNRLILALLGILIIAWIINSTLQFKRNSAFIMEIAEKYKLPIETVAKAQISKHPLEKVTRGRFELGIYGDHTSIEVTEYRKILFEEICTSFDQLDHLSIVITGTKALKVYGGNKPVVFNQSYKNECIK